MNEESSSRLSWLPVLLASLGMFLLAVLVLPHSPGMGDSAEMTLALALAGIPHPTGYPLYVLLGHAFVLAARSLGISWVTAANLWSAAGAAVAIGAMVRVAQHLLVESEVKRTRSAWPAILLPVAALAFHPAWLDTATVAEVYGWYQAMLALSVAAFFGWLLDLDRGGESPPPPMRT